VDLSEKLTRLGGVATRAQLLAVCSRKELQDAVLAGSVVLVARGRFALPAADDARVAAHRLSGVVSHRSAALHWGWAVRTPPTAPEVTLPKNRNLAAGQAAGVVVHRAAVPAAEVVDGVTSRRRTLVDCLRAGPLGEALAVADSALRSGFPPADLHDLARTMRGPGSVLARRVAGAADGAAANAFESALRAIALTVRGLEVRPQVSVRDPHFLGRPDLVDRRLRIVIEADSFEWHGRRRQLVRDAHRYNAFGSRGWLVLRFTWEDVMFHADEVRATLEAAVKERTYRLCPCCRAA
jgi:very-short-patch-repair endonuclease